MAMSDSVRAATEGHWLGGPLTSELEALALAAAEGGEAALAWQEVVDCLNHLGGEHARRTWRLILAYSPSAVITLAEKLQSENEEMSRKAAVEILKYFQEAAEEELAAEAARAESEEQGLVAALSDDETEMMLMILAEARARQGAIDNNDTKAKKQRR
jgi:hypothetical protein